MLLDGKIFFFGSRRRAVHTLVQKIIIILVKF